MKTLSCFSRGAAASVYRKFTRDKSYLSSYGKGSYFLKWLASLVCCLAVTPLYAAPGDVIGSSDPNYCAFSIFDGSNAEVAFKYGSYAGQGMGTDAHVLTMMDNSAVGGSGGTLEQCTDGNYTSCAAIASNDIGITAAPVYLKGTTTDGGHVATLQCSSDGTNLATMNDPQAAAAPEIDISRGASIADGGTDAQGAVAVGQNVTLTYTITNSGGADLNVTGITDAALTNVQIVSITPGAALPFAVADSGGTQTFTVIYKVLASGPFSFELDIASDDSDEANYDITVSGNGATSNNAQLIKDTTRRVRNNFHVSQNRQLVSSMSGLTLYRHLDSAQSNPGGSSTNFDHFNGNFSFNLRNFVNTMARAEQEKDQESLARINNASDSQHGPLTTNAYQSDFNLWAKGSWVKSREDRANTNEKSDFSILHVGGDYRYSKDLLIGIMAEIDNTEHDSSVLNYKAESNGWMLGPYLVKRFENKLILDLYAGWGEGDNEISPFNTYKDDYDSERFLFSGNLTGSYDRGNWHINPSAGVVYFRDKLDSYTDSNGLLIDSQVIEMGSLNFGPTFIYRYQNSDGMQINPEIGIEGIYDFKVPDLYGINGITVGTEDLRAKLKLGVNILTRSGTVFSANYAYDGIGQSGYQAQSAGISFTTPIKLGKNGASLAGSYSLRGVRELENGGEEPVYDAMVKITIPF